MSRTPHTSTLTPLVHNTLTRYVRDPHGITYRADIPLEVGDIIVDNAYLPRWRTWFPRKDKFYQVERIASTRKGAVAHLRRYRANSADELPKAVCIYYDPTTEKTSLIERYGVFDWKAGTKRTFRKQTYVIMSVLKEGNRVEYRLQHTKIR